MDLDGQRTFLSLSDFVTAFRVVGHDFGLFGVQGDDVQVALVALHELALVKATDRPC